MGSFLSPENTVNLTTQNLQVTAGGNNSLAAGGQSQVVTGAGFALKGVTLGKDSSLNLTSYDLGADVALAAINSANITSTHVLEVLRSSQQGALDIAQGAVLAAQQTALTAVPHNEVAASQVEAIKKIGIAVAVGAGVLGVIYILTK